MKASNIREGAAAPEETAAAPTRAAVITDRLGRRLALRELGLIEEQDIIVAMGPHSQNEVALRRGMYAAQIAMVDDQPIAVPTTYRLYRAMMQLVRIEGVVAVMEHFAPREPVGEPLAQLDGGPDGYILVPENGGTAVYRVAGAEEDGVDDAKK